MVTILPIILFEGVNYDTECLIVNFNTECLLGSNTSGLNLIMKIDSVQNQSDMYGNLVCRHFQV